MTNVWGKRCRGNQNKPFVFNNFPPPEIRDVYEIIWKNGVHPNRPQMTISRMRIECWVPKDTNTSSEYVKIIAFLLQQS